VGNPYAVRFGAFVINSIQRDLLLAARRRSAVSLIHGALLLAYPVTSDDLRRGVASLALPDGLAELLTCTRVSTLDSFSWQMSASPVLKKTRSKQKAAFF
jgi:hypothetical protein